MGEFKVTIPVLFIVVNGLMEKNGLGTRFWNGTSYARVQKWICS